MRGVIVFVLDLHHDDVTALGHQMRPDHRQYFAVPVLRRLQALRIIRAQWKALGDHPVWQASRVPLGADVRSGARDHPESHLLHELHEVLKLAQVDVTFDRLVVVPEDVRLDGIEAGAAELREPVTPERARAAGIVECAAVDERVDAVDGETIRVVADDVGIGELVFALRRLGEDQRAVEQFESARANDRRERRGCRKLEKLSSRSFHRITNSHAPSPPAPPPRGGRGERIPNYDPLPLRKRVARKRRVRGFPECRRS
jgi:hypothetical protein